MDGLGSQTVRETFVQIWALQLNSRASLDEFLNFREAGAERIRGALWMRIVRKAWNTVGVPRRY